MSQHAEDPNKTWLSSVVPSSGLCLIFIYPILNWLSNCGRTDCKWGSWQDRQGKSSMWDI